MSIKVDVKFKGFDALKKKLGSRALNAAIFNKKTSEKVGKTVIIEMKNLIAKGISPIAAPWPNKFEKYKPSYIDTIKKQKGEYRGKKVSPVNLKLTGDFLKSLTSGTVNNINGTFAKAFFNDETSALKEKGHREGANKQKKRPVIPIKNEKFRATILTQAKKMYTEDAKKNLKDFLK
jgi:hypothetical protein